MRMTARLAIVMTLTMRVALPTPADTRVLYFDAGTTSWQNSTINTNNYAALGGNVGTRNMFAAASDGMDQLVAAADAGPWYTNDINTNSYNSVVVNVNANNFFASRSGSLDQILFNGTTLQWDTYSRISKTYNSITLNVSNNLFGASATGGVDWITHDGSNFVVNKTIGSSVYTRIVRDATVANKLYGIHAGGLDMISYYDAGGGGDWHVDALSTTAYTALTKDGANTMRIYAARANGGVDILAGSGGGAGTWTTYTFNTDRTYDALTYNLGAGNQFFAARADGGVDWNRFNPSSPDDFYSDQVDDGTYNVLGTDGTLANKIYGSYIPEPATLSLLVLGTAGVLLRRRRA